MRHPKLLHLVEAYERVDKKLDATRLAVWTAFVEAEPELANEILKLFLTVDEAARWTAASISEHGGSPAREAAEGRAAEIMSKVRKTIHGFVA